MDKTFQAGFGRVKTTPDFSCPLGGFGNEPARYHNNVLDDIYVSCIALTDRDGQTVLLVASDMINADTPVCQRIRREAAEATAVPEDRIYISASHTHSAPAMRTSTRADTTPFIEFLVPRAVEACVNAMADRRPAVMYVGSSETRQMNFVKHYIARHNETGELSFIGDQFGTTEGKTIIGHTTQADETLYAVSFKREGAPNIVLVNWRGHPHFTCGYTAYDLAADYIGPFRKAFEEATGDYVAYFQGACGNLNTSTRIAKERRFAKKDMIPFGRELARYAMEAVAAGKVCSSDRIRTGQKIFHARINHGLDHKVEDARRVADFWAETYDDKGVRELAGSLGFRSIYQCNRVIANSQLGKTTELTVNALSIGDSLGMVTYPGELFDILSVSIENQSPFDTTLMLGYCHHNAGYMPAAVTYTYTSYETDNTAYAQGVGEELVAFYVDMLEDLK